MLGLFLFANIVSAIFTPDPSLTISYMLITFYLIVLWLFLTCIIHEDPVHLLNTIWRGYLIAALVAVSFGVLGYLRLVPNYELFLFWDRVRGPFKDPNVYGPFLVPAALYLIYRLEHASRSQFVLFFSMLLFIAFGILLSFSRGAWFNLAIAVLAYAGLRFLTARSTIDVFRLLVVVSLIITGIIGVTVWAVSSSPDIGGVFFRRARLFQDYDRNRGGRFETLAAVANEAYQHPLGVGPGQSGKKFGLEPHNLYLHVLYEIGWLGALAFIGFILLTLTQSFSFCFYPSHIQALYIVAFASIIGLLAESMIIHTTHWRHFYLLLAMLWGPIAGREKC